MMSQKTHVTGNLQMGNLLCLIPGQKLRFPMIADSEVIGVLDVQSPYINAFTQTEKTVLGALAAEIAVAIARGKQLAWQREQAWLTAAQLQVADTIGRGRDLDDIVTAVSPTDTYVIGAGFLC